MNSQFSNYFEYNTTDILREIKHDKDVVDENKLVLRMYGATRAALEVTGCDSARIW